MPVAVRFVAIDLLQSLLSSVDAGPNGAPTLHGCLATFHCDTYAVHLAGDHSIILGQITAAATQPDERDGLLFKRGGFGRFTPAP